MNALVTAVRSEAIEVVRYGKREPELTRGRTFVEFTLADGQSFEFEWATWVAELPAVGSEWTLEQAEQEP